MDGTIIGQGSFVVPSTIVNQIIAIPSGVDWMYVYNYTQSGVNGVTAPPFGVRYYWQRGMAPGTGLVEYKTSTASGLNLDTMLTGGFTLYDPSGQSAGALPLLGNAVATTASTNATRPVVSTASTAGLAVGSVVRLSSTAQNDINGIDMVVGAVVANTSFTLLTATNALATVPGVVGGAGFYRIVNADNLFYPRRRFVSNITNAVTPTVSTTVAHGLTPGQLVRFEIPFLSPASGMTQLNLVAATILSVVDDFNFIINVDTSAMSAFTWPTVAQQPSSFPIVVPVGEDTANALLNVNAQTPVIGGLQINNTNTGILADSTVNTAVLGMILGTSGNGRALTTAITGPAGSAAGDVMFWRAGKSTFGGL